MHALMPAWPDTTRACMEHSFWQSQTSRSTTSDIPFLSWPFMWLFMCIISYLHPTYHYYIRSRPIIVESWLFWACRSRTKRCTLSAAPPAWSWESRSSFLMLQWSRRSRKIWLHQLQLRLHLLDEPSQTEPIYSEWMNENARENDRLCNNLHWRQGKQERRAPHYETTDSARLVRSTYGLHVNFNGDSAQKFPLPLSHSQQPPLVMAR